MPPKRRRRFQGLYHHSSPPKVLSMDSGISNQNMHKRRDFDDFSVKLSTIRIWMHEKDIGKLTRILWAGQGNRLRQQASTNAKVKRFLAAVPYVMNSIKDVHIAVINNNLETLQANLEPPVPPTLITCKDANGLNVIHKAAGLGHAMILEYIIGIWPDGTHEVDITGKTPLHWAASCKNNMRCYALLTQAGCDEEAQDYKMKTPSYYRHKPHEIERAFLVYIPEAPRVSPDIATDWEALSGDTGDGKKVDIKFPETFTNGFHDRSYENVPETDVIEGGIDMHEEELQPDGYKSNEDVESIAESENTHEAEAESEKKPESEEPQENQVDTKVEFVTMTEQGNRDQAIEEKISNNLNDTSKTPTTTNTLEDTETQNEEKEEVDGENDSYDNGEPKSPDLTGTDNQNEGEYDDNEEETLETKVGDDDGKSNATESTDQKLEYVENLKIYDEIKKTNQDINDKPIENDDEQEEEANIESKNIADETGDENLHETLKIVSMCNFEVHTNLASVNKKENLKENGNKNNENDNHTDTENETDGIKIGEEKDIYKEDSVKETEIKDEVTNLTKEAENEEKSVKIRNETEFESNKELNKPSNDENIENRYSYIDKKNEKHNKTEKEEEAEQEKGESLSRNGKDAEVIKPEKHNNEIIENKNVDDGYRFQSATIINSLGKFSKGNNIVTDGIRYSGGSIKSTKNQDKDDDKADDDDDQDNKVENDLKDSKVKSKKEYDENHNEEQFEVDSPTISLAIEGYIQGESEDNTVQSQSAAYIDEESRIQSIIASGDMEKLAQIVLNGDGKKLLNMQAPESEIQAFLNNVPNYMNKIRRVHEAAREGNIMALQQALDRRKFAIAKDDISPKGSSPLHVAVLFGHADIVRYLGARFPETTAAADDDGRTALHYAATIRDNGHFYNVLMQLGANPLTLDKFGHTPKFYLESEDARDILTYRQLLETFGVAELEEELLNDQGHPNGNYFEMNPIFRTEQGKYLASTLAEPLTKALTEIANVRPEDPVAYLANFLKKYSRETEINGHSNSSKTESTAVIESSTSPEKSHTELNTMGVGSGKIGHIQINGRDKNANGTTNEDKEDSALSPDEAFQQKLVDRDEHGQSLLHFSCARSHRRGGLLHIIEESNIDITYRDELYRTARDVSLQANQPANAKEIDHYVLSLAIVGDLAPFEHLALQGYDHIIDVVNDEDEGIIDVVKVKGHDDLTDFFKNIRSLEEQREQLHECIRSNNFARVHELTSGSSGKWLIEAKNYYGRTALHIAVLKESEEIVQHFVDLCPEALKIGDNLERTALHYAMGTNAVETISRILIQKGAKRTTKDLKGRQPTYYFMNKADILRLQEEEDENR